MAKLRATITALLGVLAVIATVPLAHAQDDDSGFANSLGAIVSSLDIFFSMPLREWNRGIVRLPNVRQDGIFGSIEQGLGVRYNAGGFTVTLEPDFKTLEKLSCLRIEFETTRAFSDARLTTIEEEKIKPLMKTLSRRYDGSYALKSTDPGILFTLFIARLKDDICRAYDQAKQETRRSRLIG